TGTKELVSWMRGHESSVFSISVHASGRYAISTSSDTAQLWDLDTFQRKRKLNIRQSVGIQKVFFLPLSNTILSCFKDNSIFAWECDTLFCKYQLPAPPESSSMLYKVFAVTRDGRILAAGGKSNHLHLWCLEAAQLFRIIQMPTKVRAVRHLEFLPDSFDAGSNQVSRRNVRYCTFEKDHTSFGTVLALIYSTYIMPPPPLVKVIEELPKNTLSSNDLKMKIVSKRIQRPTKSRENKAQTRILKQGLAGNFENEELCTKTKSGFQTLSALAHWSVIFSDMPYLPLLAFPFVKLFQNNQLICFEVVATLITNWCQHWFEYFPNPPINVLSMIENVLAFHDKELLQHFIDHDITSQLYAWPLLETVFSEVLTREEWLKLFDNVFSNHPSFLLMAVVAYNTYSRAPLLHCTLKDDFEYFFHHRNNLDISAVVREVYRLMETTPADIHPNSLLSGFAALTKGQYPVFNQYPKFIVDYQTQERERIRNDELDYLRERQTVETMQAEVEEQRAEDEAWYQKQELLRKAEETRREMLLQEEEKMAQQRQRLAAVRRELRIKELHLQDAARRRLLQVQQDQREAELRRLEDEIERKVHMRDQEIATTAKDLEIRRMELESQEKLYEKNFTRNQEAVAREIRDDANAYRQKVDLEEKMFHKLVETGQTPNRKAQKVIEDSLAKAEQACLNADWQIQALHKQKCDDVQRNEGYQEVVKLLQKNRRKETEVLNAMMEEEAKKWKEAEEKEFYLKSEKKAAALSDASRKWFLKQEISAALEHAENPLHKGECPRGLFSPQASQLNGVPEMDSSPETSLPRKITEWDSMEQNLVKKVRNLRQRLTAQARSRCQMPCSLVV
uniref:TBC1 domain family member 31 n=1 Tax=Jaculus jaculus TaxID=51337 RepID=A0A8C5P694_JACJA